MRGSLDWLHFGDVCVYIYNIHTHMQSYVYTCIHAYRQTYIQKYVHTYVTDIRTDRPGQDRTGQDRQTQACIKTCNLT